MPLPRHLIHTVLAALLLLAACGEDAGSEAVDPAADDSAADCVDGVNCDDAVDTVGPATGACLEGSSDCDDNPTPAGETGAGMGTGMVVDGGLSVEEALSRTPQDGIIAVGGFVYVDDRGILLCGDIELSGPAACASGALQLVGLDLDALTVPLQETDGVRLSEGQVTLLGTVENGVMTIDPMSN